MTHPLLDCASIDQPPEQYLRAVGQVNLKRVQEALQVSERRVCGATGWGRSSLRYRARSSAEQQRLAEDFRKLHRAPPILLLPNCWDPMSARIFEAAGFPAAARP